MRILGIDPGSRVTGYGIITVHNNQAIYHASGCIKLGDGPLPGRLAQIFADLQSLIQSHQPQVMAIEQVFVSHNVSSAIKLGQARGAAICAGASAGLPVSEYTATQIKQTVAGTGRAAKQQIQHMVKMLLKVQGEIATDAADALAVALTHARFSQAQNQLERTGDRQ
ncbi:MAG: crossover junction endodeoxyribonuclease RuvC [Nevskiales bacterium]